MTAGTLTPEAPLSVVADSARLTRRELHRWVRRPAPVIAGLAFPVMLVLVFGYLFGGAFALPGGDYLAYLMPGMFALTMMFGIENTMTAVATDLRRGVTDRFRSMPITRSAVLAGRTAADLLHAVVVLLVLVACGLAVGWRAGGGVLPALAAAGLLLLLRLAMLWFGVFLGLVVPDPTAVTAVQVLVWPVGMLSGVFVSPATMPGWLGAVADWNPITATAAAVRVLCGNPGWPTGTWAGTHPVLLAVAWPVVLLAVFAALAVRRYARLGG